MEREEVYYVFRNAAGRILKILTRSLVSGNPALAAELSPVPLDARLTKKHVRLHLFPRCGVPNVFRVQIRLASLYKFDFCLGRVRDTVIL